MDAQAIAKDAVIRALKEMANEVGFAPSDIDPNTSLVDDIGLDSLLFVDLTIELEDALSLPSFPMQEWADAQLARHDGQRFTVAALVATCAQLLEQQHAAMVEATS